MDEAYGSVVDLARWYTRNHNEESPDATRSATSQLRLHRQPPHRITITAIEAASVGAAGRGGYRAALDM